MSLQVLVEGDLHLGGRQVAFYRGAGAGAVDQQAYGGVFQLRPIRRDLHHGHRHSEGEHRTLADLTLDLESPAHGFHQPFADGQAEARAAKLAGGRLVDLGEGAEQAADLVGWNADT